MIFETRDYLQKLLRRHGVWLRKSLGQHLLVDDIALQDIAAAACEKPNCHIVEIGAGAGSLTVALLAHKADVTCIELDRRFIDIHKELSAGLLTSDDHGTLDFFYGDALKFDFNGMARKVKKRGKSFVIAGNIPYQITSPLIMKIIEEAVPFDSMTLMMQTEVAQRLMAKPGSHAIGAITLKVQYFCDIEIIRDVSNRSFLPPPKVQSRVLRFRRKQGIDTDPQKCRRLFSLIDAGYSQRRKVLPNSVASAALNNWTRPAVAAALQAIGKKPTARAEELGIEDWIALDEALKNIKTEQT